MVRFHQIFSSTNFFQLKHIQLFSRSQASSSIFFVLLATVFGFDDLTSYELKSGVPADWVDLRFSDRCSLFVSDGLLSNPFQLSAGEVGDDAWLKPETGKSFHLLTTRISFDFISLTKNCIYCCPSQSHPDAFRTHLNCGSIDIHPLRGRQIDQIHIHFAAKKHYCRTMNSNPFYWSHRPKINGREWLSCGVELSKKQKANSLVINDKKKVVVGCVRNLIEFLNGKTKNRHFQTRATIHNRSTLRNFVHRFKVNVS